MMTQNPVPLITSEVPILAGDMMRDIKTPVVQPPANPLATMERASSPEATTVANALATRRLSAGAKIAESIGIDLNAIGRVEAKKIMSLEHKVLGFRPPHGSLAAEAQAAAAKHPDGAHRPDPEKLKEAAKIDAERILAERKEKEKTASSVSVKAGGVEAAESALDLDNITEEEARTLMSHEHRALGFRPPPGSLAAEAQAAAAKNAEAPTARRNSNEPARKPRQNSIGSADAFKTKPRRGSSGSPVKQRRGSNESTEAQPGQTKRRGSNESQKSRRGSNEIKRTSSDQAGAKPSDTASSWRRASTTAALSPSAKEELLKEAALRDAERIKATRGINGTTATENAHVEVKDVTANDRVEETINLPAPAQSNVDHDAKTDVTPTEKVVPSEPIVPTEAEGGVTPGEVLDGELEHEDVATPVMSRSETNDSVQIICDVLA